MRDSTKAGQKYVKAWEDARSNASESFLKVPLVCGLPVRNKWTWRKGVVLRIMEDPYLQILVRFLDGQEGTREPGHFETAGGQPIGDPPKSALIGAVPVEVGMRIQNKKTWRRGRVLSLHPSQNSSLQIQLDFGGESMVEIENFETELGEALAEPLKNIVMNKPGLRVQNEKSGRCATVIDTRPTQPGFFLLRFDDGTEDVREIARFQSDSRDTIIDFIPSDLDMASARTFFKVTPGLRIRHINTWRLATVVEVSDDSTETFLVRFNNGTEEHCELSDFETCYGLSLAKHPPCLDHPATSRDDVWKGSAEASASGVNNKRSKRKPAESLKPWPKNAADSDWQQWETPFDTGLPREDIWKQRPCENHENEPEKTHPPPNPQQTSGIESSEYDKIEIENACVPGTRSHVPDTNIETRNFCDDIDSGEHVAEVIERDVPRIGNVAAKGSDQGDQTAH